MLAVVISITISIIWILPFKCSFVFIKNVNSLWLWKECVCLKEVFFSTLASVAQLVGASSCKPKGLGFDSGRGHRPRVRVQACQGVYESQPIDEVSLMFLSLCLSFSSPLSKINEHVLE